jgi:hypothetical protein
MDRICHPQAYWAAKKERQQKAAEVSEIDALRATVARLERELEAARGLLRETKPMCDIERRAGCGGNCGRCHGCRTMAFLAGKEVT